MGQTHSAPPQDALRFRQMVRKWGVIELARPSLTLTEQVLGAYKNNLDALRRCFDPSLNALQIGNATQPATVAIIFTLPNELLWQISRATYLDIVIQEQVGIDAITDSLEREEQQNALMDEKMEFFAAVEQGKLVLGDTLLHLAVRLGHEAIVDFLLLTDHRVHSPEGRAMTTQSPKSSQTPNTPLASSKTLLPTQSSSPPGLLNTMQTPNFKGELPKDVVGDNLFVKLFLENVSDVHEVFGFEYKDEARVHRFVACLRRIWPLWMFDGQQEVANLVRVLYDVRSSDPAFSNLVKVSMAVSECFRSVVSQDGVQLAVRLMRKHDGDIQKARQTLAKEWTSDQKRQLLVEIFRRWFRKFKWCNGQNEERDKAYVDFFDAAMDVWLQIVQDLHLHHQGNQVAELDVAVLKRYELQIWKRRVHPALTYIDDLCTHITALESYLELAHLKP